MYTQRKIHRGFIGFLFIAALVLLFFFHTRPAQQEFKQLSEAFSKAQQETASLQGKRASLTPKGTLSEVEQKELGQAIPETIQQSGIIIDLNRISKSTDVALNVLTFTNQKSEQLKTLAISASFQGTPANITRFLKLVEVNPRKLLVKDAGVSRSETAGGLNLMNLNVTLQAFYRKDS